MFTQFTTTNVFYSKKNQRSKFDHTFILGYRGIITLLAHPPSQKFKIEDLCINIIASL
jgi:hypothetical protein